MLLLLPALACWCVVCVQADALPGVVVDLTAEAADDLLQQGPGQAAG